MYNRFPLALRSKRRRARVGRDSGYNSKTMEATLKARQARTGILIVLLTLLAGLALGTFSFLRYKHSVQAIEDLFTGLVYFLEAHDGRMPASAEEFLESDFIERLPDGGVRILPRPDSRYRKASYGAVIADLAKFHVNWGLDLGSLRFEEELLAARDAKGREQLLIGDVASLNARKAFTLDLLQIHAELTGDPIDTYDPRAEYEAKKAREAASQQP